VNEADGKLSSELWKWRTWKFWKEFSILPIWETGNESCVFYIADIGILQPWAFGVFTITYTK